MNVEIQKAAQAAVELLGLVGRASTPPVDDRKLQIHTHSYDAPNDAVYPVAIIGDAAPFNHQEIPFAKVHPNSIEHFMASPGDYQALVVNGRDLGTQWRGADTGSASWKSDLIYEACSRFRVVGVPIYLLQPATLTTPFLRWKSLATVTLPGFNDVSEETGNPHTKLWNVLMRLDDAK